MSDLAGDASYGFDDDPDQKVTSPCSLYLLDDNALILC